MFESKTVLITGGAGAVGSRLAKHLAPMCKRLIILDDLSSGYIWNVPDHKNVLFIQGDVANDVDLKRCFNEQPDIIFHLAAFFANQNSVDYPENDLKTNGLGTLKLYEYSALYGRLERLVYASSGCSVYGDAPMPYKEEVIKPMKLSTPYQITKMLGELYGNYFVRQYHLPITYARFFNSYGAGEVPGQYRNVIPNFIFWAMQGKPLPITGTGSETRDFTYVGDIVQGLLKLATAPDVVGEAFNLAAGREVAISDVAETINRLTGNKASVVYKPRRKWDSKPHLLASNEKAKRVLGFEPTLDFEVGILDAIEWFQENFVLIEQDAGFGPGLSSAVR